MRKKWRSVLVLTMAAVMLMFSACSGAKDYYDQTGKDYNRNLFYQNDLTIRAADPSVIHITEGTDEGYYYMYATSDQISCVGYQSWRSKDLSRWECMGVAFLPERDAWGLHNFWAPEVVYYKTPAEEAAGQPGKYYMFYNAQNAFKSRRICIGLAVADNPAGPFIQWTGTNADDRVVGMQDAYLDSSLFPSDAYLRNKPFIDASPFVDDDGELYLYLTLDIQQGETNSSIWGMKLKDMFTPDYTTSKQLTKFGRITVDGGDGEDNRIAETNRTNEAPFMYRKGDRYYLTYSVSQYFAANYSVAQAVSDGPLGDFRKIEWEKGGRLITAMPNNPDPDAWFIEDTYDHMTGTGHHSFIKVGDELFASYHAFIDREAGTIALGRSIACDRVMFVNNGEEEILYVNGPSYSIQPLPEVTSGYKNIAPNATITCEQTSSTSDVKYLNDGIYKNHNYDFIHEFEAEGKTAKIKLTFDKPYIVRAVMVYNALDFYYSFSSVKKISLGGLNITELAFPNKYIFTDPNDRSFGIMRAGGTATAEFNERVVSEITIEISARGAADGLRISDIVILGKEVAA